MAQPGAAADQPGSIVEDFSYPGAAEVLERRGITLHKGDGRIMLVGCGSDPNRPPADLILVQTNDLTLPGGPNFCFKATGTSGYLSMEIPKVYFIRGDNSRTTSATLEVLPADEQSEPAEIKTEKIDPGEWQPVGVGASEGEAILLELRYPYAAS
ncbi:hypothetical protein E0H26_13430 [Micromonospora zingiberis]|uniref:Uncharacterized protein n=1 Tax=Micromonospora zingiberis TaxID=2053011 RepID=A0A4R0GLJ1_9ACTN|nr:hypothetical protein [Micromonospora zingiberis]TCB97263.1 hypothetical protein E0H26_13430 [Micromonospora zingiberis]